MSSGAKRVHERTNPAALERFWARWPKHFPKPVQVVNVFVPAKFVAVGSEIKGVV